MGIQMQDEVIMIGVGEMGGVFARGILRAGYPIVPVSRDMDLQTIAKDYPEPLFVFITVGEADLQNCLNNLPEQWKSRVGLLQNELLPRDWLATTDQPTVISVWFEKKKGQDFKVLIPSPMYGPQSKLLNDALNKLDIPSRIVKDEAELLFELVVKNVYILTTNICGLITKGNVEDLWANNESLAREVASEVIQIQEFLTNETFDSELLISGMLEGIRGDLEHNCMGRSAPARLQRALSIADDAGLKVNMLRKIAKQYL